MAVYINTLEISKLMTGLNVIVCDLYVDTLSITY